MFRLFQTQAASVNDVMSEQPVVPTNLPRSPNLAGHLAIPAGSMTQSAPFVTRVPRQRLSYLYSYGKQTREWFRMISTGAVESTKFEPYNGVMFDATFNQGLYEAGYPQNTGISAKVASLPPELARGDGPKMRPQAQQRNSIFTRRAFNTAPSLPAKPTGS